MTTVEHAFIDILFNKRFIAEILYRGSEDGFSAKIFHNKCDGKGPTLTIVQSTKRNIFGGFCSILWDSVSGYT